MKNLAEVRVKYDNVHLTIILEEYDENHQVSNEVNCKDLGRCKSGCVANQNLPRV
jgi:hypothetical protein